jgi:hypothetical protein
MGRPGDYFDGSERWHVVDHTRALAALASFQSPESSVPPGEIYSADSYNASWSYTTIFRISMSHAWPGDVMRLLAKCAGRDLKCRIIVASFSWAFVRLVETYLVHRRICAAHLDIRIALMHCSGLIKDGKPTICHPVWPFKWSIST